MPYRCNLTYFLVLTIVLRKSVRLPSFVEIKEIMVKKFHRNHFIPYYNLDGFGKLSFQIRIFKKDLLFNILKQYARISERSIQNFRL